MSLLSDSELNEFFNMKDKVVCYDKPHNSNRNKLFELLSNKSHEENANLKKICKALSYSYIGKKRYMKNSVHTQYSSYDICDVCKNSHPMILDKEAYICYKCGNEKKYSNEKHNPNMLTHNTSANALMQFKIIGPDNHRYQKSLIRTSSDYKTYRRGFNIREFISLNRKTINPLPITVLIKAAELFTDVQDDGNIVRADFKLGVWGALIDFECIRAKITKKPKEIAKFVGVSVKYLSKGQRAVRKWNEDGLISVPTRSNPIPDFIDQYFEMLKIDIKYKQFILEIIKRIKDKRINIYSSSNPSTQVVAIIWALTEQLGLPISHSDIIKYCSISKSTYISYYKLILTNEKNLRKAFKHHNIPIPKTWKPFRKKKKRIITRKLTRTISKVPKDHLYQDIKHLLF